MTKPQKIVLLVTLLTGICLTAFPRWTMPDVISTGERYGVGRHFILSRPTYCQLESKVCNLPNSHREAAAASADYELILQEWALLILAAATCFLICALLQPPTLRREFAKRRTDAA